MKAAFANPLSSRTLTLLASFCLLSKVQFYESQILESTLYNRISKPIHLPFCPSCPTYMLARYKNFVEVSSTQPRKSTSSTEHLETIPSSMAQFPPRLTIKTNKTLSLLSCCRICYSDINVKFVTALQFYTNIIGPQQCQASSAPIASFIQSVGKTHRLQSSGSMSCDIRDA